MPTHLQTLLISISNSIPPPFYSSIIIHMHRILSMSFSSATLIPHSSTQLLGLPGRGRAFPFTHFNTLWPSSVSWTSAFINSTTSPIWIWIWIRINGSTSHSYTIHSIPFSLSSSDPTEQGQSFFHIAPTLKEKHKVL